MTQASTVDIVRTAVSAGAGGALRVGRPLHGGALTLFPLYHVAPVASYLLYADVCGRGGVTVTEVDDDGAVSQLVVTNAGAAPVLLVEGEILVGLKQNRVLNTSVLVPALTSTVVPVACVEAGRWRRSYGTVQRDAYLLSPRVRAGKNRSVQRSMRVAGDFHADQGAVWSGVDERLAAHGVNSGTSAYSQLHQGRGRDIGALVAELRPRRGQRGVLAAVAGEVVCLDLFDRGRTLRHLWSSLVGSYAADALRDCAGDLRPLTRADVGSTPDVVAALAGGAQVVAGTAWLFGDERLEGLVHTLVVDEAGQVSLANVIAMAGATGNLILCGDPQQLRQPTQGTHPKGAERSALEHLLDGEHTIAEDRGLFLDTTWRMHPAVCAFVSAAFYDGRLASRPECGRQTVFGPWPLDGAGVRYIPVDHHGNRVTSPEEVDVVRHAVDALLRTGRWMGRYGVDRRMVLDDILVVAPYNAHVNRLREALPPGARVGTVDRFQGQEAPVVIYTMATSSGGDQRRSMDFLYSLNRLNVAISRAQGLAVLVCSPALLGVHCRTADQLVLANALCRLVEMAPGGGEVATPEAGCLVFEVPA